ncbi:hypothetical protein, partial [Streptomyces sp. NPDC002758]
ALTHPDADHRRTLVLALAAEELRAELQVIRLVQEGNHLLLHDDAARDDPKVPLTEAQRDAVVEGVGWERIGPWVIDGDDAEAPVRNAIW